MPAFVPDAAVGTETSLIGYELSQNKQLFFEPCPVGSLAVGRMSGEAEALLYVGGECEVKGLSPETGEELFWAVASEAVSALAMCDDGRLVAGSADAELRSFENSDSSVEREETGAPLTLCATGGGRVAYGLCNGTVGADCPRPAGTGEGASQLNRPSHG